MLPLLDYWNELDDGILACVAAGDTTPSEIGRRLGLSEGAVCSILAMLAIEGRVRICRVAPGEGDVTSASLSAAGSCAP
jgi:hypothetical protein